MPFTSTGTPGLYPARPSYSKDDLCTAYVGKSIDELRTPAFLIDKKKMQRNCNQLLKSVEVAGVAARVHVKTHKTIEGALLQLGEGGIKAIMVSTLAEARYFALSGLFQDITYAVPLSPDKIQEVFQLSQTIERFHIFVDNHVIIDALERYAIAMSGTAAINPSSALSQGLVGSNAPSTPKPLFRAFLKIDTGYGRAGVTGSSAVDLARRLHTCPHIEFSGLYSHSGQSYSAVDLAESLITAREEVVATLTLAQKLRSLGISAPFASVGATPSVKALLEISGAAREAIMEARLATGNETVLAKEADALACDVAESVLPEDEHTTATATVGGGSRSELDPNAEILQPTVPVTSPHDFVLEVHLGNYVFLDVQQTAGMPWPLDSCAAVVLTRVLSQYPDREEVLIDAGALALSKDTPGPRGSKLFPGYGVIADESGTRTVSRISQEHGIVSDVSREDMETSMQIGNLLQVVPNHACLAAACFDWYYVVDEGKVVDVWVPCRGW
ncbi:hypothetical protein HKX48_007236 [Thoreauomyces humboldtii]|nr:hypothetical protein HKX48_007236 [Thoreauomyces humboldtii]